MQTPICQRLGIEFPLFAFSHARDVVVAVSKAGGMGVLGVAGYSPQRLKEELDWIDAHVGGKPYGVDLIVPNAHEAKAGASIDVEAMVGGLSQQHKDFAAQRLASRGIDAGALEAERRNGGQAPSR